MNLKQLAQYLDLSPTTVSRALNGFPEVSERTRDRVMAAAEELDYRPNPSAASLATGKTRAIGHVVPMAEHRMINPHFADFLAGAGVVYAESGYDMIMRVVTPEEEESVYRDFARRKRVDGVVVVGPMIEDPRIALLSELGMPFIVHGRSDGVEATYSYLDVDNARAFEQLTNHLIELGHHRIALINGLEAMNFAKRRRDGYERALRSAGIDPEPAFMSSADMVEPYGYEGTRRMLELENRPTAFVHSSILTAMGGVRAIADAGLVLGRDVSVACFDDRLSFLQHQGHQAGSGQFTSVQSSIHRAGERVARILLDQINGAEPSRVQEVWEARLVTGDTTGAPR